MRSRWGRRPREAVRVLLGACLCPAPPVPAMTLPLERFPHQDSVPTLSILFTPQLHPNYSLPSASGLKCGFSWGHSMGPEGA